MRFVTLKGQRSDKGPRRSACCIWATTQLNNFIAAISEYASWGYFDYRFESDEFAEGYQSVPVNWGISHPRKKGFFELARCITQGD